MFTNLYITLDGLSRLMTSNLSAFDVFSTQSVHQHDILNSCNDEFKSLLVLISEKIVDIRSVSNVTLSSVTSGSSDVLSLLNAIRSEQKIGTDDLRQRLSSISRPLPITRETEVVGPSSLTVEDAAAILHLNERNESISSSFSNADELNEKLNDMAYQLNESVSVGNVVLANVAAYSSDGILSALSEVRDGSISSVKAMLSRFDSLESMVNIVKANVDEVKCNSLESNLVIASRLDSIKKTTVDLKKVLSDKIEDCKTSVAGVAKLLDERFTFKSEFTPSALKDLSTLESKLEEFDSRSKQTQALLEPFVASETEQRMRERGNLSAIAETVCEIQAMLAMHSRTPQRVPHSASRSSRLETPSK